jgi:transglutaminase-like putative cysteine protease
MVIMARAVGIPARFVSGYYAHEQEDGQTVVRGRDAHAWAECWVDAVGWITVDATPSTGTPDELYPPPSAWRRGWDFLCDLPRLIRRVLSKIDRIIVVEFAGAASVIALLTSLYRYWRRRRKRAAAQWRSYTGLTPDLAAAARRFERAASHQGLLLLPHRTWRESLDAAPVPFRNFVAEYDILRFGGAGDMRRLNQLLDQIEKEPRNAK